MSLRKNKDTVLIANPIYDVIFRYLMEDNLSARMFIGVVLGVEVLELTFKPTDNTHKSEVSENVITVTRMDFNAQIKEKDGTERLVIIELQKAKYHHQIMRFRKYLGKQYQKTDNIDIAGEPLPIFPIYILGESFTEEEIPVIRVKRDYFNAATEEVIKRKYVFIESLTHDAVVIQVKWLKQNRRTRLERFLSIFDQTAKTQNGDGHILEISKKEYPEEFERIIKRLESAAGRPELEDTMDMEDEIIAEFNLRDKKYEVKEKEAKRNLELAKEQTKIAEEKTKESENLSLRLRETVINLYKIKMSLQDIAQITKSSIDEVKGIISNIS